MHILTQKKKDVYPKVRRPKRQQQLLATSSVQTPFVGRVNFFIQIHPLRHRPQEEWTWDPFWRWGCEVSRCLHKEGGRWKISHLGWGRASTATFCSIQTVTPQKKQAKKKLWASQERKVEWINLGTLVQVGLLDAKGEKDKKNRIERSKQDQGV